MSRIGNKHIILPEDVTLTVNEGVATVKGKLGTLTVNIPAKIHVNIEEKTVVLTRDDDEIQTKELHGTTRANLANAVEGVSNGFAKTLVIIGTGYRCRLLGNSVVLKVGYSHEVTIEALEGVKLEILDKENTKLKVSGIDKEKVGQTAALIRDVRRPEPYGGKGIRYENEYVPHKEGKRASGGKK